jgi:hypothetical protein
MSNSSGTSNAKRKAGEGALYVPSAAADNEPQEPEGKQQHQQDPRRNDLYSTLQAQGVCLLGTGFRLNRSVAQDMSLAHLAFMVKMNSSAILEVDNLCKVEHGT